jgi:hypothetical protein
MTGLPEAEASGFLEMAGGDLDTAVCEAAHRFSQPRLASS